MICGILAAIAGIILAARMYSGQPTVVGGTSFSGGVGTIGGVMLGALVILLAVYIDTVKKKKS